MKNLLTEIEGIFVDLWAMGGVVRIPQNKNVPFSSGQNIKPVTLPKYAYFQLLLNCLTLKNEYPIPSLTIDI